MLFDRSAHAYGVTWAILSNHCHRSAGWVRVIRVEGGVILTGISRKQPKILEN